MDSLLTPDFNQWLISFIEQNTPLLKFLIPLIPSIMMLLLVWSIYWKGRALWKAAKQDDKLWFVALLIVNTVGLLEIFYLYYFSKKGRGEQG